VAVSPKILKAHGCDPKLWKDLFSPKDPKDKPREIRKLETLIQNRVSDGQLRCISQYRTWAAVDLAYDVPFLQTTPTIIQAMIGKKWEKQEDLLAELQKWGLKVDDLFLEAEVNGVRGLKFNVPTFYKIFVPLVKAYVTIRWAKLYNDRNRVPLFKYEPMQPNQENRILCEILTYLVQVMSADFNYSAMIRDVIFQTLMYSICLSFPRDVWTRQTQTELDENGKEKDEIQKEGIRYELPHPSLMFYDLDYPVYTFNTDTGCQFGGYWKVLRYGDVLDNGNYWNRKNVSYGSQNWNQVFLANNYFQELFPCRLAFPVCGNGTGTGREQQAIYYSTDQRDMAVTQTDLFMKLVPAKWKLGTYKHPIWVRFIVASDNTVLYAEPCAYPPVRYCGYDSNSLRAKNSSMALEVLPFQDEVGNLLSQILLTCKQNLLRVHFYDKNQIDSNQIDSFKNQGELNYRSAIFLPFDPMQLARSGGSSIDQLVKTVDFGNKNIQDLFQSINTTLGILERLLQLSAQESGSAASHQQSKAEIDLVGSATSNRVQFTGGYVDDFMDATKVQIYEASMAYMADVVEAMVDSGIPDVEQHLKTLGFEIVSDGMEGKLKVRGSKRAIKIDALATSRHTGDRTNDSQTAQVMMQTVQAIAANPQIAQALGMTPILSLFEKAAILAGADPDFKLRPDMKAQVNALQAMAEQIQIAAAKHATDTIAKPAAEEMAKMQQEIQQLDAAMAKVIQQIQPSPPPAAQPPAQPINAPPPTQPINPGPAGTAQPVPVV
jgi:hypothetical protein